MASKDFLTDRQKEAMRCLTDDNTQIVLYGGAAGGGKSVLGWIWQIATRINHNETQGIIGRKSLKDLITITYEQKFYEVLYMLQERLQKSIKTNYNSQKGILYFENGSYIYLKDLSHNPSDGQYDRLKVEVMDAWIEEATQVPYKAYQALLPRIRKNLLHGKKKLLITSNPGEGWIKETFIKKKDGTPIILPEYMRYIPATIDDNPDEAFRSNYLQSFDTMDERTRQMYRYGNWDFMDIDNPFFYTFNKDIHFIEKRYTIVGDERWYVSFDFNKTPCTLIVGIKASKYYAIVDVILSDGIDTETPLQNICRRFKEKYIDSALVNRHNIIITGDASGKSGSVMTKSNAGFYHDICLMTGIPMENTSVRKANMSHKESREQCNRFIREIGIHIYMSAYLLVNDVMKAYADNDGGIDDAKKEHGLHIVDAFRYWIDCVLGHKEWRDYLVYFNRL